MQASLQSGIVENKRVEKRVWRKTRRISPSGISRGVKYLDFLANQVVFTGESPRDQNCQKLERIAKPFLSELTRQSGTVLHRCHKQLNMVFYLNLFCNKITGLTTIQQVASIFY